MYIQKNRSKTKKNKNKYIRIVGIYIYTSQSIIQTNETISETDNLTHTYRLY